MLPAQMMHFAKNHLTDQNFHFFFLRCEHIQKIVVMSTLTLFKPPRTPKMKAVFFGIACLLAFAGANCGGLRFNIASGCASNRTIAVEDEVCRPGMIRIYSPFGNKVYSATRAICSSGHCLWQCWKHDRTCTSRDWEPCARENDAWLPCDACFDINPAWQVVFVSDDGSTSELVVSWSGRDWSHVGRPKNSTATALPADSFYRRGF